MTNTYLKYASVILDVAIDKTLDYGIPQEFADLIHRGMRVEVPVRGYPRKGYVFAIKDSADYPKALPISKVLSETELITSELFDLALWMSKYYCTPLQQILKVMLPSSIRKETQHKQQLFVMRAKTKDQLKEECVKLREKHTAQADVLDVMLLVKKGLLLSELLEETGGTRSPVDTLVKKGLLALDQVRIDRSPLIGEEYLKTSPKKLNNDQAKALQKIQKDLDQNSYATHLLHGVTGSGKTEVYLQAIDHALKKGKGTIMLVPEISLTAQTIERFRSRFEGQIAILHHRLSHGERFDEWHKIRRGEAKIVIGARSAIFSPVQNLGLIIVDEEHELSYKSEEMPCYHARDIAVMRGHKQKSVVILGSATPSLESYYNAKNNKYQLSELHVRADSASLPNVTIVDMKREFEKAQGYTNFSEALIDGIKKRWELGEQTILFLNRRGYHTTLLCQECREPVKCNHCDVALTFHKGQNHLACHLCGYSIAPPPTKCPHCKSPNPMKYKGTGTELVEKNLQALFPELRTMRMDADTTRHKGSHQKLLRAFGTGKADILIGTQMIAKGLHFPQVTLVGVLNTDTTLNIPDYRASETVFQLITQVAGRSGRGEMKGEVIIQTHMPENSTILHASKQDYTGFYEEEIQSREFFHYPPFCRMVKLRYSGKNQKEVEGFAIQVRNEIGKRLTSKYELHPVVPGGYAKVKDQYRFQCLVRGPDIGAMVGVIEQVKEMIKAPNGVKMQVDVNPTTTFF